MLEQKNTDSELDYEQFKKKTKLKANLTGLFVFFSIGPIIIMSFSYYLFTLQVISFFLLCFISWSIFLATISSLVMAELIVRKLRIKVPVIS